MLPTDYCFIWYSFFTSIFLSELFALGVVANFLSTIRVGMIHENSGYSNIGPYKYLTNSKSIVPSLSSLIVLRMLNTV